MSILLNVFTFALLIISLLLSLVVLMQRAKSDGGLGSAMGGGMAEATFGADTTNVLSKATINLAILFFVVACGLYLGRIYQRKHAMAIGSSLPSIAVPISPVKPVPAPPSSIALPAPVKVPPPASTPQQAPAKSP